jgi:phage terminase small subunit
MAKFNSNKLSTRQQRFVDEYLVDMNGTQAAIRAGYKQRTADQQASRLLTKVKIKDLIEEKRQRLQIKTEVTAERVLEEYARIAFANVGEYLSYGPKGTLLIDSKKLPKELLACISGVKDIPDGKGGTTVQVLFHDKMVALAAISKHLGIQGADKHDVNLKADETLREAFTSRIAGIANNLTGPEEETGGGAGDQGADG